MARSINEIYNQIISAQQADSTLSGMNSISTTALFKLYAYLFALCGFTLETLWDAYQVTINKNLADKIPGTIRWYYNQCLAWQYGDAFIWDGSKFIYELIDTTKQIIKFVAVTEQYGQVIIKVAKSVSGVPTALSSGEIASFTAYINSIKYAGTNVLIISYSPDLVQLNLSIGIDPLVMNADGSLIADGTSPVNDAINSYLAGITYGGVFNKTKCLEAILAVGGITDAYFNSVYAKTNSGIYAIASGQNYISLSGSYLWDVITTSIPLQINYYI